MGSLPLLLYDNKLKLACLPLLTPGHMIPMVDMARLFAKHGVDVTIITTPANALRFQQDVDFDFCCGHPIRTLTIPFPAAQVGLPEGLENLNEAQSNEMASKIFAGVAMIQTQMEEALVALAPDCIVSDMFYLWTVDVADRLGIPRLYFNGQSYFQFCVEDCVESSGVHNRVSSDSELFSVPGLPHKIEMIKSQLPEWIRTQNEVTKMIDKTKEGLRRSYGSVVNSFTELETPYEAVFKSIFGIKAWSVGPVSLWANQDGRNLEHRGQKQTTIETQNLFSWLDSKHHRSVLYVSFGSLVKFPLAQLVEIAYGLESSGYHFIWVLRKKNEDEDVDSVLGAFEDRMKQSKQGYVINGWAPQLLIFDHPAVGGFLTHCGWNSMLEGIVAGLPIITWPIFGDQFYNDKYVTDVLRIGVGVGVKRSDNIYDINKELIKRERIAKTVALLMGSGELAREMRTKVRGLSIAAKKAIKNDGSSPANLKALIAELNALKTERLIKLKATFAF